MSRSERMPVTCRSAPVMTTAPILRSASSLTAVASVAVGSMVRTSLPLRDNIALTVMAPSVATDGPCTGVASRKRRPDGLGAPLELARSVLAPIAFDHETQLGPPQGRRCINAMHAATQYRGMLAAV